MEIKNGVLYIGGFELPDKNAAAQRVIANGKIFKALGYQTYFLGVSKSMAEATEMEQIDDFGGFKFYQSKYPIKLTDWFKYLFTVKNVNDILKQIPNVQIIVAYNYPAIALMRLKRICNSKNISLVADCTEWYEPQGPLLFKVIKQLDTYLRMRIIHPRLDGVIAISSYLYNFYRRRIFNLIQVPPLVDLQEEKWGHYVNKGTREELTLVYAGSPGSGTKDRIDTILKSLHRIKVASGIKFVLNVIGLSEKQYKEDFGDAVYLEELGPSVIFNGRLTHIETLNEVKKADYMIFVRDQSVLNSAGFPTKFVESLSCSTPVLTNLSSNLADYLKDGVNGYELNNLTQEKLDETLKFALSQTVEKIEEMRRYIRNENTFDYTNYIEPFRYFIDQLPNKGR